LLARAADGYWQVEDVVRGRWSPAERNAVMLATAQADAAKYGRADVTIGIEQEPGSAGEECAAASVRLLAGYAVYADRVTGSKEVRAEPFAAQAEAGNVRILRGAWKGAYLDELLAFPSSRFSDQTDATSGAFNRLATRDPFIWEDEQPIAGPPNISYRGRPY
jgi:predicted phage terminase large subunit-like protein